MKALISPDEKIYGLENNLLGSRVAYFYDEPFDVAEPMFFLDVEDSLAELDSQFYYYDEQTNQVVKLPEDVVQERIYPKPKTKQEKSIDQLVEELVNKKLAELSANTN
jgi:hypothetical protein